MNGADYQRLAMRTNDRKATDRLSQKVNEWMAGSPDGIDIGGVLNGVLGLTGESGEFADIIKKWIFHQKELDIDHAKKELGDVMWYVAMICESFDWSLDEVMGMNIDKLIARYPIGEGFTVERANHRKEGDI